MDDSAENQFGSRPGAESFRSPGKLTSRDASLALAEWCALPAQPSLSGRVVPCVGKLSDFDDAPAANPPDERANFLNGAGDVSTWMMNQTPHTSCIAALI
jgi:hypothetical protein